MTENVTKPDKKDVNKLMDFMFNTPFDEEVIAMDCNDGCEQIAAFAERVASGESLETLQPEFLEHMQYWKDCREEFEALVAIIKAENNGELPDFIPEDL